MSVTVEDERLTFNGNFKGDDADSCSFVNYIQIDSATTAYRRVATPDMSVSADAYAGCYACVPVSCCGVRGCAMTKVST